jgi:TatD DNase family protein
MFDTHCHLNFKAFHKILPSVIENARDAGIEHIIIPGTDVKTSKRAVEIAQENASFYAAVGIHPHHVYKLMKRGDITLDSELSEIEKLLSNSKIVAIGEVGMDRHVYEETVYADYTVDEQFVSLQIELLRRQIQLAVNNELSLILHNREAKREILDILTSELTPVLKRHSVFHCCEPDEELLSFAKEHDMFIGTDGDLTFIPEKQEFIKKVPLEMLVLETDSPFLLPEPFRAEKKYPNVPANIRIVAEMVAKLKEISAHDVIHQTTQNACELFSIPFHPYSKT